MKAPADKSPDTQRQAAAHEAPKQQSNAEAEHEFVDNRQETADLRQLQEIAGNSPQAQSLAQLSAMMNNSPHSAAMQNLQAMVDNSPRQVAQRQPYSGIQSAPVGLQAGTDNVSVQRVEDEELLQGKFTAESSVQLVQSPDAKPNNTGLPDNLKSGIESLSGMSMDNVKVHYNSSEPAQLNAHAYAQGTDIHLEPGQEQHLPHEAWHVVQQAQGRVKPTMQMKDGVEVNDDQGLESEADVMGARAASVGQRVVQRVEGAYKRSLSIITPAPYFPSNKVVQQINYTTVRRHPTKYSDELMGGIYYKPCQVQTDEGNWIDVYIGDKRYRESMDQMNSQLVYMEEDNGLFNCHGFTFGGSEAPGGPFSFLDAAPVRQLLEDEYITAPPQINGVVMFGDGSHSGIIEDIVSDADPKKDGIIVRSKLGSKSFSTESVSALEKRFGTAKYYITKIKLTQKLQTQAEELGATLAEQLALRGEMVQRARNLITETNELSDRPAPSTLSQVLGVFGLNSEVIVYQENLEQLRHAGLELQDLRNDIDEKTLIINDLKKSFDQLMTMLGI